MKKINQRHMIMVVRQLQVHGIKFMLRLIHCMTSPITFLKMVVHIFQSCIHITEPNSWTMAPDTRHRKRLLIRNMILQQELSQLILSGIQQGMELLALTTNSSSPKTSTLLKAELFIDLTKIRN